jgi:ubiquinone/menaquinone biosynthesis C-methylase UbiE
MMAAISRLLLTALLSVVALSLVVRIVRYFHKFPMPAMLASLIDNPLRRRIQPPSDMPARHSISRGMTVLEVGPGNGRYTVETARAVGEGGKVVAVDIQPSMIDRVLDRVRREGITNVEARTADVHDLPFADREFDAIYLLAVFNEIPSPEKTLAEFHRVLKPSGTLALSEILTDPDYSLARTLIKKVERSSFQLKRKLGGFFAYTLVFQKPGESVA